MGSAAAKTLRRNESVASGSDIARCLLPATAHSPAIFAPQAQNNRSRSFMCRRMRTRRKRRGMQASEVQRSQIYARQQLHGS